MPCRTGHFKIVPYEISPRDSDYAMALCLDCGSTTCKDLSDYKRNGDTVQMTRFGEIGHYEVWEKRGLR